MQVAQAIGCFAFTACIVEAGAKNPKIADGVLTCFSRGLMKTKQYLRMMDLARKGCNRIGAFAHLSLQKAFESRE